MQANDKGSTDAAGSALLAARDYSRYLCRLLEAEPALMSDSRIGQPFSAAEMRGLLDSLPVTDDATLAHALRSLRKRVMLRLIARDIGGLADLDEVVATVTALAETAITTAQFHLECWLAE
jgi:[glutamine synthetase] adenylyltransferase / [glutamine synthetase]-adenylyl-L-tyrosine phosphorylase